MAARRQAWLGIAGAVAAFAVLALLQAWTVPIYQPPDEASHVGYGVVLARGGGLPTLDTPIPTDGEARLAAWVRARDPAHQTIWTANHPPLYYALIAVPLGLGERGGHGLGGVRAARAVSIGLAAAGLLLLGWALLAAVPELPRLAVLVTAMAALVPTFVAFSSLVYNDALAFLTTTATLAAATMFLIRGPSAARLAAVAATASVAALSRASGLLAAGIAVLAVVAGALLAGGGARRAVARAAAMGAAVAAVVAAGSGWFYLRNLRLYGSATGSSALLERFDRVPRGSIVDPFVSPTFWADQQMRLWDLSFNLPGADAAASAWAVALSLVPAVGLLLGGVRVARRLPPRPWRHRPPAPGGRGVALALCLLLLGLLELSVAQFNAAGGNPHVRYLFPGLAAIGLLLAAGLTALPGGRRGLPALAMIAVLVVVNLRGWLLALGVYLPPSGAGSPLKRALAGAGAAEPAALLVPAGLVLAAAVALLGWSLLRLPAGRVEA